MLSIVGIKEIKLKRKHDKKIQELIENEDYDIKFWLRWENGWLWDHFIYNLTKISSHLIWSHLIFYDDGREEAHILMDDMRWAAGWEIRWW